MKLEESIESTTSKCMALVLIHVKSTAHLLLLASQPLVLLATTMHGPKTSKPTNEKGGSVLRRSTGKFDIFLISIFLRSLRHMTQ